MKRAFVTGGSGFVGRALIRALVLRGVEVRAMARSKTAREAVAEAGAVAIEGDLEGGAAVDEAMRGCDVVFHAAAYVEDWGNDDKAWAITVTGTEKMLAAAAAAGVPRFVHVGTEAALVDGTPIVNADETRPLPEHPIGIYPRTKAAAERRVRDANREGFATIVVRPRFVWGQGDTSLLPKFIEASKDGTLQWIGGGHYPTSTCHIDNLCEGLLKAAEKGRPGEVYFLTDGAPIEFRTLISAMLEASKVTVPTRSAPRWVVATFARVSDALYRLFDVEKRPPLPYASYLLMGREVTVNDAKARREIGYEGKVTFEEGIAGMKA